MAKFHVKRMYKKVLVPYWSRFSMIDPATWFSRDYDSIGARANLMIDGFLVKELQGKIGYHGDDSRSYGYVFEAPAPEGDVWVDCADDVVCEVVRMD